MRSNCASCLGFCPASEELKAKEGRRTVLLRLAAGEGARRCEYDHSVKDSQEDASLRHLLDDSWAEAVLPNGDREQAAEVIQRSALDALRLLDELASAFCERGPVEWEGPVSPDAYIDEGVDGCARAGRRQTNRTIGQLASADELRRLGELIISRKGEGDAERFTLHADGIEMLLAILLEQSLKDDADPLVRLRELFRENGLRFETSRSSKAAAESGSRTRG